MPQNTKQEEERELGGRQWCRRSREATLPLQALPAVSNHAPQGSEPAQIPNYFLLQCRACILDGIFPALAGEKRQPLCLPALPLLPAEQSPGGCFGKAGASFSKQGMFRLASGEGWGAMAKQRGCSSIQLTAVCPGFAGRKAAPAPTVLRKAGPPVQIPSPENVQLQHIPLFPIF